jgi:mitogen-activated protein kinase 1/3
VELVDISLHEPTGNLYVIVGAMDTDLSRILKSRQPLTEEHFQYFTLQLLEALKAMHAIGVVHTNLRPDNIYLTKSCDLRVGGFRSVQLEGTVHDCNDTRREYGQTRWYRSPEIMLQPLSPCAPSMDMFAAGCILAEMYLCQPLLPGTDYIDQIKRICKFTGYDASEDIGISDLVPRTEAFLHRHCVFSKPDLRTIFPRDTSQNGLSLLDALLKLNPSRRITAAQALQHVYFAALEGPYDCSKTTLTRPRADYFAFELDRLGEERLTCAQLQGLIDEELKSYGAEPDCTLHPLYLPLSCR